MEVRGLILLRISEAEYGRITIAIDNEDKLGFQLQVCQRVLVESTHWLPIHLHVAIESQTTVN